MAGNDGLDPAVLPGIGLRFLGAVVFILARELFMLSLSRSSTAPALTSLLVAYGALKLLPEEFMRRCDDCAFDMPATPPAALGVSFVEDLRGP